MNRIFSVLIVLSMFSFTACGDENSPAFYAGNANKIVKPKATSQVAKSEQGFLQEKDDKEEPEDLQSALGGTVFTIDKTLPVVKIKVSELLNGKIQITEVVN